MFLEWRGLDYYKDDIKRSRDRINKNNPFRTDYYKAFWEQHPEIAWSLLANLVSRNAGYQMSDLARYRAWIKEKSLAKPDVLTDIAKSELEALFAFLETANFLIFRDVYPALEAYHLAKQFQGYGNDLFDMLNDPEFDVDPFIIEEWKRFYASAQTNNWSPDWLNDWSSGSDIQRHSFALIINEQNQIEDRLVNDKDNTYLWKFGTHVGPERIVEVLNRLGITRLCFPVARSEVNPKPQHLLIYLVRNFRDLDDRIKTGRDLFVGLFENQGQSSRIQEWVRSRSSHKGTRRDYNQDNYSLSLLSLFPGGDKYSPPLVYLSGGGFFGFFKRTKPAWPLFPGRKRKYRHLHQRPIKLPISVKERTNENKILEWLMPMDEPHQELRTGQLKELSEVFI